MNAQKIKQAIQPPKKTGTNILKQAPGPKKKGGRPKKAEDEQLTKKITVNCTQAEYNQLTQNSKDSYMPVSVLIRKCLKDAGYIQ